MKQNLYISIERMIPESGERPTHLKNKLRFLFYFNGTISFFGVVVLIVVLNFHIKGICFNHRSLPSNKFWRNLEHNLVKNVSELLFCDKNKFERLNMAIMIRNAYEINKLD